MADSELEIFLQNESSKNIVIENFSFNNPTEEYYAVFEARRTYYPRLFKVTVHPNGINAGSKDYISVEVRKYLKDADPLNRYSYDIITWTLSVVDIMGAGRYYQSFTKENIVHFPYKMQIARFLKRSVLLEEADEFLPGDVLTIRCEVVFLSYPGPAIEKNCKRLGCWTFDDLGRKYRKKNKDVKPYTRNYNINIIEKGEHNLINTIDPLLETLQKIREDRLELISKQYWKKTLAKDILSDELFGTYLSSSPIFQTYCRIKRKLMRKLDMIPEHASVYQFLESKLLIPWCETRQHLKRMLMQSNKQNTNSGNGKDDLEILNEYLLEVIEYELKNEKECIEMNGTECNIDEKWNFLVETSDNITFTLLFQKDKETIGSKLLAVSPVFENMLINPMKERFCKSVKLPDVDSKTFLSMIGCLQEKEIDDRSFEGLCNLYETADKYQFKDLMHVCAALMRPLFDLENIDTVQMLSHLHSDKYLQEMVETFINQNTLYLELAENSVNQDLLETKANNTSFDFYQ